MSDNSKLEILADPVSRIACSKCGHHIEVGRAKPFSDVTCPACGKIQSVPMKLGSFLLLKELGRGGMGAVYRAYDQTLSRYVAIKVMQRSLADDQQFAQNFLREARAAAALNHPHVAQIYSCGTEKGQLYIVMELVDGGRMDEMIAGGKTMDEVRTLEVAIQVAEGLQAAHDIGMVHGDIKPANVLFDKQDRAKVVDFGLARFAKQKHQPGEIWGTPFYIAPEKVRSQPEDHRSDIYSLGATLYHALSGQPPFDGPTAKDVVLMRLKQPPPDITTICDSLHPTTAQTIARMLQMEPSLRYPTYKSLLADLRIALDDARHYKPISSTPRKKAHGSQMPVIVAAMVGVLLLGGIIWALVATTKARKDRPPPPVVTPVVTPEPEPDPTPAEPVVEIPVIQPFDEVTQRKIAQAASLWADRKVRDAERATGELFKDAQGFGKIWVGILQAMPAWSESRTPDVTRHLRGIQDAELRELPDDIRHPGHYAQVLARFMTGQSTGEDLIEESKRWPEWVQHFTLFPLGVKALQDGRLDAAESVLNEYLETKSASEEIIWPYSFQAVAQWIKQEITAWQALLQEQANLKADTAIRNLNAYRRNAPPWMSSAIDEALTAAQARKQAEDEADRAAQEVERQKLVAADRARLEALREQNVAMLTAKEFRRAGLNLRLMQDEVKTDEGRALYDALRESYERMDALRQFIIRGINSRPAPARISPDLGGDITRVTSAGLQISRGGGTITRPWDEVSERLMVALGDYYIASEALLTDTERADLYLSLAVYAYQVGGFRPAQTFTDRALGLNAALHSNVATLMPDLAERNN